VRQTGNPKEEALSDSTDDKADPKGAEGQEKKGRRMGDLAKDTLCDPAPIDQETFLLPPPRLGANWRKR